MGFYTPATIVEDAKRHRVVVRAIDVQTSDWDCTLERYPESAGGFALRMGLRYVKSLGETDWRKVEAARRARGFVSLADFVRRTRLDEGSLCALAEAGAFESLTVARRDALWNVRRLVQTRAQSLTMSVQEMNPGFDPLSDFEEVGWDYRRTAHSARRHPLAPLRRDLSRQGMPDASTVATMPNGATIRYAGLVICRQRPGTAGGVVFMTLEDETGFVNVVIWESVFQRYAVLAKTVSFLGITGKLQVEDGVVHLVAESLWQPKVELKPISARSRDFH